jgi:hypothetical protein
MAHVVLLSATPADDQTPDHLAPLRDMQKRAACDRRGVHRLTSSPEEADVILFVESYGAGWHFERVRRHPFTRRYREKCFLFCSNPYVIPFLPGIYTARDQRWSSRRTISGFHLGAAENEFATFIPPVADLPYLYSFVGSMENATVRRDLMTLKHPRGFIQDTSAEFARVLQRAMNAAERRDYHRRYADITKASKFVLCPRGLSVSSIRLFETMKMGRVPVILSDGWVEPPGPAWDKFALRVREADFALLPQLLEEREGEAVAMGEWARRELLEWVAEETAFHTAVEWCLRIKAERRVPEQLRRWPVYLQYLRPFHFRRALRSKWGDMQRRAERAAGGGVDGQ